MVKTRWLWFVCVVLLTGCYSLVYPHGAYEGIPTFTNDPKTGMIEEITVGLPADAAKDLSVLTVDVSTGQKEEVILNLPRGLRWQELLKTEESRKRYYTVGMSKRKARLLTFTFDGECVGNTPLPNVLATEYMGASYAALSPDSQHFAYQDPDRRSLRVLSVSGLSEAFALPNVAKYEAQDIEWVSEKQLLVLLSSRFVGGESEYADSIIRVTLPEGTIEVLYRGKNLHSEFIWGRTVNPLSKDRRLYAFREGTGFEDGCTLNVLDLQTKKIIHTDKKGSRFLCWDPDGKRLAYTRYIKNSGTFPLVVYSLSDGQEVTVPSALSPYGAAFVGSAQLAYVLGDAHTTRHTFVLADLQNKREVDAFECKAYRKIRTSSNGGKVILWGRT